MSMAGGPCRTIVHQRRQLDLHVPLTSCYYYGLAWGYSSAGRALAWHARGQRFDPAYLHQGFSRVPVSCGAAPLAVRNQIDRTQSRSSRGLGHHPFTVSTGVRIPYGTPSFYERLDLLSESRRFCLRYVRLAAAAAGWRASTSARPATSALRRLFACDVTGVAPAAVACPRTSSRLPEERWLATTTHRAARRCGIGRLEFPRGLPTALAADPPLPPPWLGAWGFACPVAAGRVERAPPACVGQRHGDLLQQWVIG